jgi:hypothetical protein
LGEFGLNAVPVLIVPLTDYNAEAPLVQTKRALENQIKGKIPELGIESDKFKIIVC